jgi:hypothetical protein
MSEPERMTHIANNATQIEAHIERHTGARA